MQEVSKRCGKTRKTKVIWSDLVSFRIGFGNCFVLDSTKKVGGILGFTTTHFQIKDAIISK